MKIKQQDFEEIYHIRVDFWSKGRIEDNYPLGMNLSSWKTKDEKALLKVSKQDFLPTLVKILNNKTSPDDTFKVEKLTLPDFDSLALHIRVKSIGQIFSYGLECPYEKCGKSFTVDTDMSKLKSSELDKDYKKSLNIEVEGEKFKLKLPTVEDYISIHQEKEELQDNILYAAALDMPLEEAIKVIDEKTPKVTAYIKKFLELYDYGFKFTSSIKCPICKGGARFRVPFRTTMFFQLEEISESDFRDAIRS